MSSERPAGRFDAVRDALGSPRDWHVGRLTGLLGLGVIGLLALRWPRVRAFPWYAFYDEGVNFAIQAMIDRGAVPTVDFGYPYGLASLLLGRAWFAVFGRTPDGYVAATLACELLMVWGLARLAAAARLSRLGLAVLVVGLPYMARSGYASFAYGFERALLAHALAAAARGRPERGLALATAAAFVKPTMAYVLGFWFVVGIVWRWAESGWPRAIRAAVRPLLPAVLTGLAVGGGCAVAFGLGPTLHALLPLTGAEGYRQMGFGFFRGSGRSFWQPPGASWKYYVGTVAGFWLLANLALIALAVRDGRGWRAGAPRCGLVLGCALAHTAFVCLFFGHQWSWYYYSYILISGLAAALTGGRDRVWIGLLALALAVTGQRQLLEEVRAWRTTAPRGDLLGLYASDVEAEEWRQVVRSIGSDRAVVAGPLGGGIEALEPERFGPPTTSYLQPGDVLRIEVERKAEQVAAARWVVVPQVLEPAATFLAKWPRLRDALEGCTLAFEGSGVVLYHRPER